jgi:hypothetical protein
LKMNMNITEGKANSNNPAFAFIRLPRVFFIESIHSNFLGCPGLRA